jgi:hypothetical protein
LGVNNTITAVNVTANTGVFTGNANGLNNIPGANVTGAVANATFATTAGSTTTAGTVTTNAQPNITSVGSLTSLIVSGNAIAGNVYANSGTVGASLLTGTLTTAAQPNITSVGTLTTLGVNNTVTAVAFTANTGVFTGNGSGLSAIAGANVTGTVANATFATSAGSATTAGTVTTAAQPNITSVGTLTSLGVSGAVTASRLTSNVATGTAPLTVTSTTRVANLNVATDGTAESATSATNASALLQNTSSATTVYPTFSTSSANGNSSAVINTSISANLANASITATTFVGALSGAATSATSATNAAAVLSNVRSTGTYYPTFISATANGNYALNSSAAFSANLTTGTVFATDFNGNLIVSNTNYGTSVGLTGLTTNYFGNSAATSGNITFQRFRGNNTAFFELLNGDQIGLINFVAWDGYNINPAASITSIVDAEYTPSVLTSAPGAIVFNTANATQGGVPTEKMRVTSTGNVGIANTNPAHTLSITGTLNASGSANVGSLGTTGSVTATGNVSGGNLTTGGAVVATGNISGGNIIATGYHLRSVGTGISANGTTQAQATAITKEMNIVSTVLTTQGVVLPTAIAGMVITITNTSANSLLVYPAVNGIINTQSANAAYSQPSGATLQFIAPTTTQWYTVGATFA